MFARAEVECGEVWSDAGECAEENNGVEVDVLEAFGVGCDSVDETLEVGALERRVGENRNEKGGWVGEL